jgi:hypothetical protein
VDPPDSQHREIGCRIVANHVGTEPPAVEQRDPRGRGLVDDVAVGEDESVRREHEA